ncbi:MAG: tRNA (adenosine(37)-N6)-threonylcarbamoyltransferase complex transferase subunit TsaD [candidate division Zixibacteria bacterium]|nr:tRNA (adenosine(37)-N6)-threonylcarbamoyltransferase complex transferase subunit TsaD [candidate division Zixibacteria bacterium]
MRILGIETSCDETALAVVEDGRKVLCEFVYSQVEHAEFGGIVPEIASRQQIRKIGPLFQACNEAFPLAPNTIDGIAVTCGPGLVGSLLVGLNFAKGLAYGWELPFLGINHLEGHIFANYLSDDSILSPFICLIVSGGHTMIVKVNDWCDYDVLGSTRDDAAGEAYDKVAKLLGLGYPGGGRIDSLAAGGDPAFHRFPAAKFKTGGYQFSFSGLKTAVAMYLKDKTESFIGDHLADICASFQARVVDMLVSPTISAAKDHQINTVAIGGGVAANSGLRREFERRAAAEKIRVFFPDLKYCTDNGAMIAAAGCYRMQRGERSDFSLTATPYLPLIS